jgi:hypothetical protein
LHRYRVYIAQQAGQWCVWLTPGGEWTEWCPRAAAFGHATWLARASIEECGDRRLRTPKQKEFGSETHILPLKPEFGFTGHAAYPDATAAWQRILKASRAALQEGKDAAKGQ